MTQKTIKQVKQIKKGKFFHLLNKDLSQKKEVYQRGDYDRSWRKYEIQNHHDINDLRYVDGDVACIVADL